MYSFLYSQHALWAVRPDAEQHGALVLWSSKNCGSRRTLQLDHVKTERERGGGERESEKAERARKWHHCDARIPSVERADSRSLQRQDASGVPADIFARCGSQ